jgi:hypothetical protein
MGRFEKGTSGNPAGRPPGTGRKTAHLRRLLNPHIESVAEQALAKALTGDATAMLAVATIHATVSRGTTP